MKVLHMQPPTCLHTNQPRSTLCECFNWLAHSSHPTTMCRHPRTTHSMVMVHHHIHQIALLHAKRNSNGRTPHEWRFTHATSPALPCVSAPPGWPTRATPVPSAGAPGASIPRRWCTITPPIARETQFERPNAARMEVYPRNQPCSTLCECST